MYKTNIGFIYASSKDAARLFQYFVSLSNFPRYDAAVIHGFLGPDSSLSLASLSFEDELEPACPDCRLGGGRGDLAALVDDLPEVLLAALDDLIASLRLGGDGVCPVADRLELCEFRHRNAFTLLRRPLQPECSFPLYHPFLAYARIPFWESKFWVNFSEKKRS